MLRDGIHEGIISETDWELAHQKREKTGVKYEKTHSLDHEHISVSYTHLAFLFYFGEKSEEKQDA